MPLTVTVKLFATFRDGRFKVERRSYTETTTIGQVIQELELPEDQLGAILLNARHVEQDVVLHDGDTLSIFPLVGGG
ncbi:MAG: MoaD/ThiS family protein [Syntrophotaleaceae bacterium]